MDCPFDYDHVQALVFGGTLPTQTTFDAASVVFGPAGPVIEYVEAAF